MPDGTPTVRTHAFICPHCHKPASGETRGVAVRAGVNSADHYEPPAEYAFIQCALCRHVSIEWREDYGGGFALDDPVILYPAPRRLSMDVPQLLRNEWEDARRSFEAKLYKPCAVMVRSTVEGTCELNGVKEKTLGQALRKMRADDKIDDTLYQWSDMLRVVGNQGAHFTETPVTREDAQDALAFAEALLDHIYVLRKRFDEFKGRQASGT